MLLDRPEIFDVLTMGRIGVDVYPLQVGVSLREVTSFGKYLGGSPTNVAVAAARYGRRSAVITRTGQDPASTCTTPCAASTTRYVTAMPGLPTPVTFCEIFPPDDFPLYFYRYPKAPDLEIRPEELDLDAIRAARVFWVTVTGLSQEAQRRSDAPSARWRPGRKSGITILDLDYRPVFWPSREEARPWVQRGAGASRSRSGTWTSATRPSASASPTPPPGRCASAGSRSWWSSRAPRGYWPQTGRPRSRSRRCRWRWSTASAPATRSGGALPRAARLGPGAADAVLQRRRGAGRLPAGLRRRHA